MVGAAHPRILAATAVMLLATLPASARDEADTPNQLSLAIQRQSDEPVFRDAAVSSEAERIYHWLDQAGQRHDESMFGYRWNRFRFERIAVEPVRTDEAQRHREIQQYKARISRLSFRPANNLTMRLARGRVSGLDYLIADESLRRTALSATWTTRFDLAQLESTVAWGRNSRKMRESTSGFLLESTARFTQAHALFGRLEQVGSDEFRRDEDGVARQWFKLNRFTVGYFQEMDAGPGLRLQLGGFVSRYLVPSAFAQGAGDPTVYMMFARFRLQ